MRRAHDPSRLRRRGHRRCRDPQQQGGDAGSLGRQSELAAGDEIELPCVAPDFQHHDPERIAGQRIGRCPQRAVDIGGAHRHDQARIEAEFGEATHRQRAGFNFGKILPHPDQRPARRDPPGKAGNESRRRDALVSLGKHFVHRGHGKTAAQRRIGVGMAERHPVQRLRVTGRFDALDAPSQTRKRADACAVHARRSLWKWCCH